jgi:Uma2 family endonuclease
LTSRDDDESVVVMSAIDQMLTEWSAAVLKERRMTLHEYFATPEVSYPQELVDGVIRVADAPFVSHQRVVLRLALALDAHARETYAGEVFVAPIDVVFDRERPLVLQPDLLFVSSQRLDIVHERIYGAPDLVVEVLSPRPRIGELDERLAWFAQYGVREIWLYNQFDRTLHVLGCDNGRVQWRTTCDTETPPPSGVLPDFGRSMKSVLERP